MSVAPSLMRLMLALRNPESAALWETSASTPPPWLGGRGPPALVPLPDAPVGAVKMNCIVSGLPLRNVIVKTGDPSSPPAAALIWWMWKKLDEGWTPESSLNFQR